MSLTINSREALFSLLAFPIVYIGLKVAHRNGLINLGFGAPVNGGQVAASIPKKYLIAGGLLAVGITCVILVVQSVRGKIAAENARLQRVREEEANPQYRMSKLLGYTPEQYRLNTEKEIKEAVDFNVRRFLQPDYQLLLSDRQRDTNLSEADFYKMVTDILFHYIYNRPIPFQQIFHPDYFSITSAEATNFDQDNPETIVAAGRDQTLKDEYVGLIRSIIQGAYQTAGSDLPETTWFDVEFKISIDGNVRETEVSSPLVERR